MHREVEIYKLLSTASVSHPGRTSVRTILDSFEISWSGNHHQCLVHKPLWISLFDLQKRNPERKFTEALLKGALMYIFLALDYLHSECKVIHTGMSCLHATWNQRGLWSSYCISVIADAQTRYQSKQYPTGDRG